jgi:hypothetical protein
VGAKFGALEYGAAALLFGKEDDPSRMGRYRPLPPRGTAGPTFAQGSKSPSFRIGEGQRDGKPMLDSNPSILARKPM